MGFFDKFPYTNFHELNLDWIISKIKTVETSRDTAVSSAAAAAQSASNASASEQQAADSQSAAAGSASAAAESAAGIEAARDQIYLNTQRLNNLIVDGQQTAGNTELLDIRVGYDGTIYDTAGNAVRDQVSDLNQSINQKIRTLHTANLLNENDYVNGYYSQQGNIIYPESVWRTSNFIDVREVTSVAYSPTASGTVRTDVGLKFLATFDENKDFIELVYGADNTNPTYTKTSGVAYIRFGWNSSSYYNITLISGTTPSPVYIPYREYYEFTDSDYVDEDGLQETLDEYLQEDKSKNLWTGLNEESGYLNPNGTIHSSDSYATTDFIPVHDATHISFSGWKYKNKIKVWEKFRVNLLNYYNENKVVLGQATALTDGFDVSSGIYFIRFSYYRDIYYPLMVEDSPEPTAYEPFYEYNAVKDSNYPVIRNINSAVYKQLKGLKICAFGDSLAASGDGVDMTNNTDTWIQRVADYFGMTAYNRGIGGSRVTNQALDGSTIVQYAYVDSSGNAYARAVFSQQQTPPEGYTEISPFGTATERTNTIPVDTDILVILIGANDAYSVGTTTDYINAFKTGYRTMLDHIYARIPNARILVCQFPFHQSRDTNASYHEQYEMYRTAVKEIANEYGYPYIELRDKMMVNKNNYQTFMSNNGSDTSVVHFNCFHGRNRTADVVISYIAEQIYFNKDLGAI